MYRSHTCGELRLSDAHKQVSLSGWVQTLRDKGNILWIDLRDRYGITQLVAEENAVSPELWQTLRSVGREYVLQISGTVIERYAKNPQIPTGDIEIRVQEANVLNPALTPPFTIEDQTDGGEELRMKYRYLDLRRTPLRENLILRHKVALAVRQYLDAQNFLEIETPYLIKSTPEGARDFVVPSRMNAGEFYALPQSPQMFKQVLMVSGYDKYFQIVRCFRDEDLRADRQPEFTQIDCEMSFVNQEDVLQTFEGMIKQVFKQTKGIDLPSPFPRITYQEAMEKYGSDKPDMRFDMTFVDFTSLAKQKDFVLAQQAEAVLGIVVPNAATFTRKQLDELTLFVQKPQIGAKGLIYIRYEAENQIKSSVDKFYTQEDLAHWIKTSGAQVGDLILVLMGDLHKVRKQLNELRLHVADLQGMRNPESYKPVWVLDFPLLEWDEDTQRHHAVHHPFTSPKPEDFHLLETNPLAVRANAYDLAMNGLELGGGSIRIHDAQLQAKIFELLGFTAEEAEAQFGFLMKAFAYGAPPHGGIAFGLDRLTATLGGSDSIRDFIAFPKNNKGKDTMIDAPSALKNEQLQELSLSVLKK
jgi:aspartyl-tRNA synthetase